MNFNEEITKKIENVRYIFDEKNKELYFSIVDVIDILGVSTDPRNYWKVLKNRLKKAGSELIAKCDQLKMKSTDGKYYLTDAANPDTILQIIEIISPEKVATFEGIFNKIEKNNNLDKISIDKEEFSSLLSEEGEIQIDMYQKEDLLFIKAMLAGINPEDIFISLNTKTLILKINRIRNENRDNYPFDYKELVYGKFERTINLPFEVDIDRVETSSSYGLLTIKLCILDKTRTKIIKVK